MSLSKFLFITLSAVLFHSMHPYVKTISYLLFSFATKCPLSKSRDLVCPVHCWVTCTQNSDRPLERLQYVFVYYMKDISFPFYLVCVSGQAYVFIIKK